MNKNEALRLALEVLRDTLDKPMWNRLKIEEAITAIKKARAAPVQELAAMTFDEAWASLSWQEWRMKSPRAVFAELHRIITPPAAQRPWVGLTDDERTEIRREHYARTLPLMDAIEAKLKEKNT